MAYGNSVSGFGSRESSFYTSGSMYKKFNGSNASRMNRQSVAALGAEIGAAGSLIFGQTVAQSEGLSVLAAQALQQRVADELQAKLNSAEDSRSTALNVLT